MEGLLNYALLPGGRHQPVRPVGHVLHVPHLRPGRPLRQGYNSGDNPADNNPPPGNHDTACRTQPAAGRRPNSPTRIPACRGSAPNQPGINQNLGSPPYDPSVCPGGSTDLQLCNPAGKSTVAAPKSNGAAQPNTGATGATGPTGATGATGATGPSGDDRRPAASGQAAERHHRPYRRQPEAHPRPRPPPRPERGRHARRRHTPKPGGRVGGNVGHQADRPPRTTCSRHEKKRQAPPSSRSLRRRPWSGRSRP